MLIENFNNNLTQVIRSTGAEYAPFSGYPFLAIPSPALQVLASSDFDLAPGVSVKGVDGKDYMIADAHWLGGRIGCLVTLIPESAVAIQEIH